MERRARRELDRERVAVELGRLRLAEHGRDRDRLSPRPRARSCAPTPPAAARARRRAARRRRPARLGSDAPASRPGWRPTPAVPARRRAARSSCSSRNAIDSRERSARGPRHLHERELERQARVAALAHVVDRDREQVDQPQDRRLAELVRLRAQPLARLLGHAAATRAPRPCAARASAGAGARSGRVTSRPRSWPCSESSSTNVSAPAVSRSTTRSQSRKSASSSTVPSSCEHRLHGDLVPGRGRRAGRASTSASRYEPRAARATSASAWSGASISSRVRDHAQHLDEILQPRPLEDERLAARAHRRQHLREVGRAEDEDEVRRRLLDQLQQRVPRRVRELVRLVEDVDLVAALDRLQHDAVADLADVVDAALRRRVHLDHVERRAGGDRRGRRGTCRRASSSGPARS